MSVKSCCRTLLLSIISFNSCLVSADDMFTEQDYFPDLAAIDSATRLPQTPEEMPVSITVIDRKMIDASSAVEIVDLLRLVPGMRVAHIAGHTFIVAYHTYISDSSRSMQVLVDGRSVITPIYNMVDWVNLGLTINDIERIEVIRGSNSAAYGSNAVRGTINIITRKPFEVEGHTVELTAGANGTMNGMYRFAAVDDKLDYRVTLHTAKDDGYDDVDDHKNIKSLAYRGLYSPNYNDVFDIQLGVSGGPTGGRGLDTYPKEPPRTKETRGHYESIIWTRNSSDSVNRKFSLTNNYIFWDDTYTKWLPDLGLTSLPYYATNAMYAGEASTTDAEYQQSNYYDNFRLVWGGGYKQSRARQAILFDRPDYISTHSQRLFIEMESHLASNTLLNAGLMAEEDALIGYYYSPRLALNYSPSKNHTFRISGSESSRTPSLFEFYSNHVVRMTDPNNTALYTLYKSGGNLEEEVLTSYELSYIGHYLANRLDVDAKIYNEHFDGLIRNIPDETSTSTNNGVSIDYWMNSGYTDTQGAELHFKYIGIHDWSADLQYGYAEQTGQLLKNTESYYPDLKIAGLVPRHSYSLLLIKNLPQHMQISLSHYFNDAMDWFSGSSMGAVKRTDIKLAKTFRSRSTEGKVSLVVQNLGDDYFEYEAQKNSTHRPNLFTTRAYLQVEYSI